MNKNSKRSNAKYAKDPTLLDITLTIICICLRDLSNRATRKTRKVRNIQKVLNALKAPVARVSGNRVNYRREIITTEPSK